MIFNIKIHNVIFFFLTGLVIQAQTASSHLWGEASLHCRIKENIDPIPIADMRLVELDDVSIQKILREAPLEFATLHNSSQCLIDLPFPDGSYKKFRLVESPIVDALLQEKYVFTKTYLGTSIEDPNIIARIDYSLKGFHAIVKTNDGLLYIDPVDDGKNNLYKSYSANTLQADENFVCHAHKLENVLKEELETSHSIRAVGDQLRIFRIAIATTGEYTEFHGGTKEEAISAVVSTLNRVNLLYELEASTRFVLVENNDELIFVDPSNDPFNNNSLDDMIVQNQTLIDSVVGLANYDIGHVFGTKGGGLAGVGGACYQVKAWGATGLNYPEGDAFDIIYVAHELGHQLNATHSFSSCNGEGGGATAFEPGSGTTVMAYAGLCGSDNIQFATDFYFHSGSFERIVNSGSNCVSFIPTNNNPPSVEAISPLGLFIPIATPFELNGNGTDIDGDVLTYTWDQMDLGPVSPLGSPSGNAPLFRFMPPTENPTRIFPSLENLINNTSSLAEILPTYSRAINFRITARDNKAGGAGINYDDYRLDVSEEAGPFLVTYPNSENDTWTIGETINIEWEVANTDKSPINCSTVSIYLSQDGGYNYLIPLAENIPNTGTFSMKVPNLPAANNRIKIKAANNVFFDISNQDFSISEPEFPTFTMTTITAQASVCALDIANFSIALSSWSNFDELVSFTQTGLPLGTNMQFPSETIVPEGTIDFVVNHLEQVEAGIYPFTLTATGGGVEQTASFELQVLNTSPSNILPIYPLDVTDELSLNPTLEWTADQSAISYEVEIATSPKFANTTIEYRTTIDNQLAIQNLNPFQIYFWRIRTENNCGFGEYSTIFAFRTTKELCKEYQANNLPLTIAEGSANTIKSSIFIMDDFDLASLRIPNISGTHDFISDLSFELESPTGKSIQLTNSICGSSQNFNFGFADESEYSFIACPPTSGESYLPVDTFHTISNENSEGTWSLIITDRVAQDGGVLENWTLELCEEPTTANPLQWLNNSLMTVNQLGNKVIGREALEVRANDMEATQINYNLRSVPSAGTLKLGEVDLECGSAFTQEDINNNTLIYEQDGSFTATDDFAFDVTTEEGAWLAARFELEIMTSNLSISIELLEGLSCHNSSDASVSLIPSGGTPPYFYSMDGINFQEENIFNNLSAGSYVFSIRDANNIERFAPTVNILNPTPISVLAEVVEDQIGVTASGGTGELRYSIDGVNFGINTVFSDLENGFYTITVKDKNLCRAITTATIFVNNLEVTTEVKQVIQCSDSNDGKIKATVTGGTPPYLYSIDGVNFQTNAEFDSLTAGNYTIMVEEFEGFSQVSEPVEMEAPQAIVVSPQVSLNTIVLECIGGTGSFLYSMDGLLFQSNATFSNLENGEHTVFVQDANGCMSSASILLDYENVAAVANVDKAISCYGASDAQISLTAIAGTAPFLYQLGTNTDFQESNTFENVAAGSYLFTIQDANGLIFEGTPIQVVEPPLLILEANVYDNSLVAHSSGGTAPILYQLDNGDWTANPIFENLSAGFYTLRAIDQNNCTITSIVEIGTTGVDDKEGEKILFSLFPNPTNGVFTIDINTASLNEKSQYKIEDIQGKLWKKASLENIVTSFSLDVSDLPKGMYLLTIFSGSSVGVQRFVKD